MEYITSLWEFTVAVFSNWLAWMAAVPFFLEQGYPYLPQKVRSQADSQWPEPSRRKFLQRLCIAGLAVASFLAFNDVNTKYHAAQAKIAGSSYVSNRWEPLNSDEAFALRSEFKKLPIEKFSVLCGYAGCADLADSIFSTAHDLNWTGSYEGMYFSDGGIRQGLEIWSYPLKAGARDRIAAAIERATKGRLKVSPHEWPRDTNSPDHADDINLVVGRMR